MADNVKTDRKRRGRPPGSGADDAATLAAIADLLAAEPGLKPTSAMKRTVRKVGASQLRRLQVKWKKDGAVLLEGAQLRRKQRLAAWKESRKVPAAAWSNYAAMAAVLGPSFQHRAAMASPSLVEQAQQLALTRQDYLGVRALDLAGPKLGISNETLRAITGGILPSTLQIVAEMTKPTWMKQLDKLGELQDKLALLTDPLALRRNR